MDGVVAQASLSGYIDVCRSDGELVFIQDIQTAKRSDQDRAVAIGYERAYRVVAEFCIVFVQPGEGLFFFVEEANPVFVRSKPYIPVCAGQHGGDGFIERDVLFQLPVVGKDIQAAALCPYVDVLVRSLCCGIGRG